MKSDKEFLEWLHGRLVAVMDQNPNSDYMLRFRAIIDKYPVERTTVYVSTVVKNGEWR